MDRPYQRETKSMSNWWSFGFRALASEASDCELAEIFPLALKVDSFTNSDIINTYKKILTDVVDRTHGLDENKKPLLFDSCLQSEANEGLITLLAVAMKEKSDLFLVYKKEVNVLRKANSEEQETIKKDYGTSGKSATGVYISFKKYTRTDMLLIYSNFEYCVVSSLNKTLNLSKAIQIKVHELRSSVATVDSAVAKAQAQAIAAGLRDGKDVMLDKNDEVVTATVDTSSSEKSIEFLDSKRAFILGLPMSYISGYQTEGIGSTGEADMRAVERGLKQYFVSIIHPVLKAIWNVETKFKSQDFRQITGALEMLKTFDLVSDQYMSLEAKQEIIRRVFDLDAKAEEKAIASEEKEREANPPAKVTPFIPNRFNGNANPNA